MLAHVVVTYDVKLEDGATYPQSWHIGTFIATNSVQRSCLETGSTEWNFCTW